jgi:ABC-type bacteriocin/lantibiotic exporter with double-glycine peptidase domain
MFFALCPNSCSSRRSGKGCPAWKPVRFIIVSALLIMSQQVCVAAVPDSNSQHLEFHRTVLERRFSCGWNSLYALAVMMDASNPRSILPDTYSSLDELGVSILTLKNAAVENGFPCSVKKLSLEELRNSRLPLVLHFKFTHVTGTPEGHYVVLTQLNKETFVYLDGTTGHFSKRTIPELVSRWTGYVLEPTHQSKLNWMHTNTFKIGLLTLLGLAVLKGFSKKW